MSFEDAFRIIGISFVCAVPLLLLFKNKVHGAHQTL